MSTTTVAAIVAAHTDDRLAYPISVEVAQQMLWLLGDNEQWAVRPDATQLEVWAALRHENAVVRAEVAILFPEQAEALRVAYRSWGLDVLRGIVDGARSGRHVAEPIVVPAPVSAATHVARAVVLPEAGRFVSNQYKRRGDS